MADDRKQIILDLLARNKMRGETESAADDLDRFGRKAEEADKKTEALGHTADETGKKTEELGNATQKTTTWTESFGRQAEESARQTDKLGGSLETTKGRISGLDDRIANINKELGQMAAAWADAGDAAEKNDISKAIRKTQAELRTTTKQRGILAGLLPDEQEIEQEGQKIKTSLGKSLSGIGESLGPIIATAGVAAAPALGAVISGAVVGGVGIGGIVGGFLIASKDARVKSAAEAMKTEIGNELKAAAMPFTAVSLDAIDRFGRTIKALPFGQIFSDAAKDAGPLIDGVDTLIGKLGGAIGDLVHNSGPEIKAIGQGIGEIGTALANGLRSLGDNAHANADALSNLFTIVSTGITVVFDLINGLTKLYDFGRRYFGGGLIDGLKTINAAAAPVAGLTRDIGEGAIEAAKGTDKLGDAQTAEAKAALGQRDALSAVAKELRAQTDPAFAVLDAMDKVRDAQKEAADATHKYGSKSEEARAASRKLAEAAIDLQGDVGALGGSFDGKLTPTMRRTLSAAGLTTKQISGVEAELKRAKKAADAYDGTYVATFVTTYKTRYINQTSGNVIDPGHGQLLKRAAGGPVVRGMPYIVGENGPEIVMPSDSGRVLSAAGSRGLMVQGALKGLGSHGSGGGDRVVRVEVEGNDQRLVSLLKYLIRTANVMEA